MADRTDEEIKAAERKAVADAISAEQDAEKKQLEVEAAQRSALKEFVPDLSKVERGSLTAPDSSTIFVGLLGSRALDDAAADLIPIVETALGKHFKVLLTNDLQLATKDAGYGSVVRHLESLKAQIERFRNPVKDLGPVAPAALVAAQLLPGLLSLASARRSLANSAGTIDDQIALMAVAGKLAGQDAQSVVVVDQARLVSNDSAAVRSWAELQTACEELAVELAEQADQHDKTWAEDGASLVKSVRAALAAVVSTDGKEPSALAKAALQESLHSDAFGGILIIKGGAAAGTQLVNDRPLMFNDKISVVSTATIAYLLVNHREGCKVLRGGLVIGKAQLNGQIGTNLPLP